MGNNDETTTTTATTMTALAAQHFGPPRESLAFHKNLPLPPLNSTQVLIQVSYTDVNPVDAQKLQQKPKGTAVPKRNGNPLFVVGFGGCGRIVQVGEEVPKKMDQHCNDGSDILQVGALAVFLCDASLNGSYATHVAVDWRLVSAVPKEPEVGDRMMAQLASIPVAGNTAIEALEKVGLPMLGKDSSTNNNSSQPPKTLLVVGGSGGVGSWATVLARATYPNLQIIHTASAPDDAATQDWCIQTLGANQVIGHDQIDTALTGGRQGSVDAILCLTEPKPAVMDAMANVLKVHGQICLVVAGASIKNLDLSFVFFKSGAVHTETVFSTARAGFPKGNNQARQMRHVARGIVAGTIKAPLNPQYEQYLDWAEALSNKRKKNDGDATDSILDQISSGHTRGKLVMKITTST